jgi:hypothetical protein
MGRAIVLLMGLAGVGCGPTPGRDGGTPAVDAGVYVPVEKRALGLNDATFLFPLSVDGGRPTPFAAADTMIPRALFDRLTTTPGDVLTDLSRLRLVGLRFDLCDRATPSPCDPTADGVLRLVHQPVFADGTTEDIALHSFFPIPRSEVAETVDTLRALARLQDVPRGAALKVNTALDVNPEFTEKLTGLVRRYVTTSRLFRLTLFGQLTNRPSLIWVFRGIQKQGPAFVRIDIPDLQEVDQVTLLASANELRTTPLADDPPGFARAMSVMGFGSATPAQQREALESMAASDNPLLTTADTIQCVTCHVTTTVMADRAAVAGVPITSLTSRYTSATFDLSPLGDAAVRFRTLRALGYLGRAPIVAQRTVNETANVLQELEARFPPAP